MYTKTQSHTEHKYNRAHKVKPLCISNIVQKSNQNPMKNTMTTNEVNNLTKKRSNLKQTFIHTKEMNAKL